MKGKTETGEGRKLEDEEPCDENPETREKTKID